MDAKEKAVRRMALLLADELSVAEDRLRLIIEKAFHMDNKDEAYNYLCDEIWSLIVEEIKEAIKIAEDKNDEVISELFLLSQLNRIEISVKNTIKIYARQFFKEISLSSKLTSFYKPKISKDTLKLAREAANLPHTAKSSITNMKVLLTLTITDILNKADLFLMSGKGAAGYIGVRQSSYDCPLCDSLCGYFIPITTQVFPAHPRCVCGMIPIYNGEYD